MEGINFKKGIFNILSAILITFLYTGCPGPANQNPSVPNPETVTTVCPTFSPIGGFYKQKQNVTISCEGATEIYYTILTAAYDESGSWNEETWRSKVEASKPTEESTKYTTPFEVGEQCIVRAMAKFSDGTKR